MRGARFKCPRSSCSVREGGGVKNHVDKAMFVGEVNSRAKWIIGCHFIIRGISKTTLWIVAANLFQFLWPSGSFTLSKWYHIHLELLFLEGAETLITSVKLNDIRRPRKFEDGGLKVRFEDEGLKFKNERKRFMSWFISIIWLKEYWTNYKRRSNNTQ